MDSGIILDFTGIRYLWRIIGRASSETFSTKAELDEVKASADSAFHWKGSVAAVEDLPDGASDGDVLWTGDAWNRLGGGEPEAITSGTIDDIFTAQEA